MSDSHLATMKPVTAYNLRVLAASIILNGILVVMALWLGKGQIAFVLLSLVLMYFGRRIGWRISRASLYGDPAAVIAVECVLWGGLIAFLIHALILWNHPHWILKSIFGFGLGAYVSIPNFGLVAESTIPPEGLKRHNLISLLPLWTFILSSIGFAFLR